jgi:hypothetical protein
LKFQELFMKILTVLTLILFSVSCCRHSSKTVLRLDSDTGKMRSQLLALIPAGSDAGRAGSLLADSGFKVSWLTNTSFAEEKAGGKISLHRHEAYIYADLERAKELFISERWQIAVVHRQGKVRDIFVSYGLTGL